MDVSREHRTACVVGLLVGDAAGAPLEFKEETITGALADFALKMPGGGCWKVGPGQITDDGELALCLVQALRKFDPLSYDPAAVVAEIARMYREWWTSGPFDVGETCGRAFGFAGTPKTGAALVTAMKQSASRITQANGALMRCAPIPAWLAPVSDASKVVELARADAALSHAHATTLDCNAAYCLAIWHLIRNPNDSAGALKLASDWVESHACVDVKDWFKLSKEDVGPLDMTQNIGHVKWAFVLAFHYLKATTSYKGGIRSTLMKGGDTDTNAAIVGAMLAALHGRVPEQLSGPVLSYKPGAGVPRPAFLTPSSVLEDGYAF